MYNNPESKEDKQRRVIAEENEKQTQNMERILLAANAGDTDE